MRKFLTNDNLETQKLGEDFAKRIKCGDVVLLIGELGAGKTTFVQGIAKGLKIKDRILSPTFVLVRNHAVDFNNIKNLNHVDLYRIEKPQDLESLGIEEFVSGKDSVTIIEWADRLLSFRPEKGYKINFNYLGNDQREILIDEI